MRALSGVKSSGEVTLGNYVGAMKRWAETQDESESFYFVPDLHVLNMKSLQKNPTAVSSLTLSTVAWLLAIGVDSKKSTIFVQSWIPAHSELAWILENYVTFGELSRMTQFKDKQAKQAKEGIIGALFAYPVLMAADILLYDADEVPIGEDQKQHVELARDIAERFNNLYGKTFKVPKPVLQEIGARVMNLQNPTSKMSKSEEDDSGNILLLDDPDTIRQKIKRAVTDSGSDIKATSDKPGVSNLLQIQAILENKSLSKLEEAYQGQVYGDLKSRVADVVIEVLTPIQAKYHDLIQNKDMLLNVLREGQAQAEPIAEAKLRQVKEKIGLLLP